MDQEKYYRQGLKELGLRRYPCPPWEKVGLYLEELLRWNTSINLTAIVDPKEIIEKHFLDSLTLLPYLPKAGRVLDVGSGAGFPGLVLKMARPDLEVVLVEAREKKVHFLRHMIRGLKIQEGIQTVARHLDPENFQRDLGPFQLIVTRATFQPDVFLRLVTPYQTRKGCVLMMRGVMKGKMGPPPKIVPYTLPFSGLQRTLWIWSEGIF